MTECNTSQSRSTGGHDAPPPRGPRAGYLLLALAMGLAGLAAGSRWSEDVKVLGGRVLHWFGSAQATQPANGQTQSPVAYYTCGMHPWVILPKPGDCPICHMALVPLDASKFTGEVTISPVVSQNIGVRIAPAVVGPVSRSIRAVASVDYDERAVRDVNIKVAGWVEKLYVDYVGQAVQKGQNLFSIYSPDLYTAQEEYLNALRMQGVSAARAGGESRQMGTDLLSAARKRLENYDISEDQLKELVASGKASKTMTIRSPHTGTVVVKNVNEGMKVDSGLLLYRIADLSNVWLMVTLYEYQLPYVQMGQDVTVSLPYIPGQEFKGKITYIYPVLNPDLRQVKVRVEVPNAGMQLKPGMFANVELHSTFARERTLVPRESVIDTGERQVVFVSLGEGRFEPRKVKLGVEADGGMMEILDGVKPGEMVVVSGQFLLDSEARLREALAKMVKGRLAGEHPAAAVVVSADAANAIPKALARPMNDVLNAYFQIQNSLADDSVANIAAPARKIAQSIDAVTATALPGDEHFWHKHTETADIRARALELASAPAIAVSREKFADLSIALGKLLRSTGVPESLGKEVQEMHCPMYREGQGGIVWLQEAGEVRNPFFGKSMLNCADRKNSLPTVKVKD